MGSGVFAGPTNVRSGESFMVSALEMTMELSSEASKDTIASDAQFIESTVIPKEVRRKKARPE